MHWGVCAIAAWEKNLHHLLVHTRDEGGRGLGGEVVCRRSQGCTSLGSTVG